jgi:Lrp/AsnC family leucine-responsive transcriptional regulator
MPRQQRAIPSLSETDRRILAILTRDATISYAQLGTAVGLSSTAAHERVRKLKQHGIISSTVAVLDPMAHENRFVCFVLIKIDDTDKISKIDALKIIDEIEEIHTIAGEFSILAKIRTIDTEHMERVFAQIYCIPGIIQSQTIVSFGTYLDRPPMLLEN